MSSRGSFEKSYTLNSYIDNKLLINSTAKDECRTQLFKHIMFLKDCMREIYGEDTDIDFKKIEIKENPQLNLNNDNTQAASMIEDVELHNYEVQGGSGCVANICETPQPTLAQKEINIDDVLNSQMLQKAVELFQPETPLRVNNKT